MNAISLYRRQIPILAGFLGWFALNGLLWVLLGRSTTYTGGFTFDIGVNLLILPANLAVLLVCAFKARPVAGGILLAFGLNVLVSSLAGLMVNANRAIPFFIRPI